MQRSGRAWRRRVHRELRRGLPRARRRFSAGRVVRAVVLVGVLAGVVVWSWNGPVGDLIRGGGTTTASADGTWQIVSVTDGDTLVVQQGGVEERVRLLGIDTPERGQCGYDEATAAMAATVASGTVTLVVGSSDDRDQYDRLLRYVDVAVDGATVDAGLRQLEQGLAAEVYDSRIGYPRHDREDAYIAADDAAPDLCPDMREH